MIDTQYIRTMARYNRWQNNSLYGCADGLDDAARRMDRGAHFRSIHETLCHLLWGDMMWMKRFADTPPPPVSSIAESPMMIEDWSALKAGRDSMDDTIAAWAETVDQKWLEQRLGWYSGSQKKNLSAPAGMLVAHMFNHQTHHRGQVHAMLTAAGARPEDTDLFVLLMEADD